MADLSSQTLQYSLRVIVVALAFPILPALPVLAAWLHWLPTELNGWWMLIWIVIALFLWRMLSRKLLVNGRFYCPVCRVKCARFDSRKAAGQSRIYLVCERCGLEEATKVGWSGS